MIEFQWQRRGPLETHDDSEFPTQGRLAAIDFGTVRIGIAICDPDRILASPLEVRAAANWRDDGDYYRSLVQQERIVGFVIGLPIHCDGGESDKSRQCRQFARWLSDQTQMPIRLFDERFTTVDANRRMAGGGYSRDKKKQRIDAVAALVLLESFLEACRYRGTVVGQTIGEKPEGGDSLQ
ncbi:MAG: Holliday junction resolvase RuvX [Pirellulales bacterium]|nr:Holliday junction resolvase RuvX [Pirellulales bacterium]